MHFYLCICSNSVHLRAAYFHSNLVLSLATLRCWQKKKEGLVWKIQLLEGELEATQQRLNEQNCAAKDWLDSVIKNKNKELMLLEAEKISMSGLEKELSAKKVEKENLVDQTINIRESYHA